MQLVECVPNFSEGRNQVVIDAIAQAVASVSTVRLLDVDSGPGANRTVVTFAGAPDVVLESAFRAIECASNLIDMRNHRGAHPRLGATDLCPFVPLHGVAMSDCVKLAERLGERVAEELDIPIFLYGEAARMPERRALPDVRRGEYEGLASRFRLPGSVPDYGNATFNASAGATIIGARPILIAFNVNLDTRLKNVAQAIAAKVRESGSMVKMLMAIRFDYRTDRSIARPGSLKSCRAIGWYIDEYECAQVSTNLIDCKTTSLHQAFSEIARQAELMGVGVTGSEIIGMVPLRAMTEAGKYFAGLNSESKVQRSQLSEKSESISSTQGRTTSSECESELLELAIESLGLRKVRNFVSEKKVIEYSLAEYGLLDVLS